MSWEELSPGTKNSCILQHWSAKGNVSDAAVNDLVKDALPAILRNGGELHDSRKQRRDVFNAANTLPPTRYEFIVCQECGLEKDPAVDHCVKCTGMRGAVRDTWETQVCHVRQLDDIVKSWFAATDSAESILDYLQPDASLPANCSLRAERYESYRELLDNLDAAASADAGPVSREPRNIVGLLHFDSFAPLRTRPDDFAVAYLLLRPILAPEHAALESMSRAWVIFDGPQKVKSLTPVASVLMRQVEACLADGVRCVWPPEARRFARTGATSVPIALHPGCEFKCRFVIGCFAADQPAAQEANGHTSHNAIMACRWGSIVGVCMGTTLARERRASYFDLDDLYGLISKGQARRHVPQETTVTWHQASIEERLNQSVCEPDVAAAVAALRRGMDFELPPSVRKQHQKQTGWGTGSLLLMLHDLYGFDVIDDVLIDGMHNWMGIIKDLTRATINVLEVVNKTTWLDRLLAQIRLQLPRVFTHGRRIPRNLTHASLKSWCAEECLIWLRLIWRPLFQELIDAAEEDDTLPALDYSELFRGIRQAWLLLESAVLPLLDKRGNSSLAIPWHCHRLSPWPSGRCRTAHR